MRYWIIGIIIIGIIGGAVVVTKSSRGGDDLDLTLAPVESAPITMTIETNGTVEPLTTVQVGCEVTGRIMELAVDHDEVVKKDQIICRIDPELPKAENSQSEADFLKAKSSVEDAKLALQEQTVDLPVHAEEALANKQDAQANLEEAQFNWERIESLKKEGNAPPFEVIFNRARFLRAKAGKVSADAAYKTAVSNETVLLARAREAVKQAEAALKLAEAHLAFTTTRVDRCTIRSPIDGVVLRRYFDVGTTVTAAFQTPILFMLAPRLDRMKIIAKVSESDILHIQEGQKARFTIEGRQPVTFEGVIKHKRNQPDVIASVVTYSVIFEVDNDAQHTLMPGLSVNVTIECVAKQPVALISNAALRFKPPLSLEEREAIRKTVEFPEKPASDAHGNPALYCSKGYLWGYEPTTHRWHVAPVWLGVTDHTNTEVLVGAKPGEKFVKKCVEKSSSGFSLKEAIKLARPTDRTL